MCTILLHLDPTADEAVVLAANRDEFRERPADDPGEIAPGIFAGRDRLAGGTWLALGRAGLAALTNVAETPRDPDARSRGELPLAALARRLPEDYAAWNAFNLVVVDRGGARVVSHAAGRGPARVSALGPGSHVIVNAPFGTACPRAAYAATLLARGRPGFEQLIDHGAHGDDGLCHHGAQYGTVSSTVVALDRALRVVRYLHRPGLPCATRSHDLTATARAVVG